MTKNTLAPSFAPSLGTAAPSATASTSSTTSMADLMPKSTAPIKPATKSQSTKSVTSGDGSKRRGPNSHRVRDMFASITEDRKPLDDIIESYHVSVHVARQSKRFDPFHTERGQVVIKTLSDDVGTKRAFIWRVPNAVSTKD